MTMKRNKKAAVLMRLSCSSTRGITTNAMMFLKPCGIGRKSRHALSCMGFCSALSAFITSSTKSVWFPVDVILFVGCGFLEQNHKGAMMELGEGLCKLMNFESGPFHQFEKEISAVLEFIYQTQLEKAACTEELCVAMDQSERSYQLLGRYGAGERLYHLEIDRSWTAYIVFCPERYGGTATEPPSIKIPVLQASEEHMMDLEYL
ncbi:UNVERIFIED_CONTAM: hypothetical protein Sradi_2109000 [Sesamum radiatum]|uniref:Uncharacterized protein n=1 Tax=Sesamum radiatum TaxID=300843 RepID=A0AAW2TJE1_SESRA